MTDLGLSPSAQLLVAAGRRALAAHGGTSPAFGAADFHDGLRSETAESIPQPIEGDLTALPDYALRHGMVAFLPHVLHAIDEQPAPIREHVDRTVRDHALSALRNAADLLSVTGHLTQAGIELVVLKGPVFSAWLYGDAAIRRSVDIDVLVHEKSRLDALKALEQIGFARRIPSAAAAAIYAGVGAWPLARAGSIGIDLHWRLSAKRFPMPLEADAVMRRAIAVRVGDQAIGAPAPIDAALLALLHAAKHVWYSLESILSIAALMRRDDVDWTEVHRLAENARVVRAAAAGLRLAADLFGTIVPAPFASAARSPAVERLCACAHVALCLPPGTFVDRSLDRRTHIAGLDRWRARVHYDVRRLLEPTRLEWEWLALPGPLTPLYVPLRVVRLVLRGIARFS